MSRRSRKAGSAVTLFFFQDIIMSTSGIMIMIVLLLCLELIERPELAATSTERPPLQIAEQVAQLQGEIELLEQRIAVTTELMQSASQMTASERTEQVQHLQTANNLMSIELEQLRGKLKQQEAQNAGIERQERKRLQEQIESARRNQAAVANAIQAEIQDDRPLFSLPRGDHREGWIVDISATRIQVAPIGKTTKPLTFVSARKGLFQSKRAADAFLTWIKSAPGNSKSYYFLFVRPDGVSDFEQISKSLNITSVSYGYDIADSKQKLLHPERGAGE